MLRNSIEIPFKSKGKSFVLKIYGSSNNAQLFEEDKAIDYGESRWQLVEGAEYEYIFDGGFYFKEHEIVRPSRSDKTRGLLSTGVYVGSLTLTATNDLNDEVDINLEIRSFKIDYRTDYQTMLNDITNHFTDLIMMQGAPVVQKFEVNYDEDSHTLYQQFAFLKSIIDTEEFEEALNKIFNNPIHRWAGTTIEKNICAVKRLGYQEIKQIVSSTNRIPLNNGMKLGGQINSVPRRIIVPYKKDTINVLENRFVKYVLFYFSSFCSVIHHSVNASNRLKKEAQLTENKISEWLSSSFFLEISDLQTMSINSPALQRKEGYRELLQAWMMSKLAAQITWKGGDNVYHAGKRNVAALYEYWVFFKLLEIVKNTFNLQLTKEGELRLIKHDKDHINLELRQGKMIMIGGTSPQSSRILNVNLYYNRTFYGSSTVQSSGSWTTNMRPDYTLSIWPGSISEKEAEEQDLIVHIHFDAKYKLSKILLDEKKSNNTNTDADGLTEDESRMNQVRNEEEKGIYKRVDLYKMHTYKDAIRRTSGAYIIYPGTENKKIKGFHEILPGLGAFCLRPNKTEDDSREIQRFLNDIIKHMLNRVSQRERIAYHTYNIHQNSPSVLIEALPEPNGTYRDMIPEETFVLLGYYRDENHLKWILKNKIYNTRTGTSKGSLRLTQEITNAKYALLHNGNKQLLLRLGDNGPRIMSKQDLQKRPFKDLYSPSHQYYVVFDIENTQIEDELLNTKWDLTKMTNDNLIGKGHNSAVPNGISLAALMKYVIKD